jgi:hypothetical protein
MLHEFAEQSRTKSSRFQCLRPKVGDLTVEIDINGGKASLIFRACR